MTQGISSSLNSALARVNYIEYSFSTLENIMGQNNVSTNNAVQNVDSEFKKILDKNIENNKVFDVKEDELIAKIDEKIDEEIKPEKQEAIALKSKIDLKAQKTNVDEIVETFANKYGIDSDFIKAIIKQESGFNPNATSKKGAMGLMQLMPKTAQALGVINAYNPWENIEGGVKYLKGLMDRFNNNHELALAAYNAGPTAVKKYGGIPPYKETQKYVNAIMNTYNKVKEANIWLQEVLEQLLKVCKL